MNHASQVDVIVLVGPTASGKTAVAIEVAGLIGAEIVNADAYQVYRGMDIGTAKPTREERAGIRHHLLDILDVRQDMSVAEYQRWGRDVLRDLRARGVPAVVVGGSGLYVRGLVDDLQFPGSDPQIRAAWEARLAEMGAPALHAVLRRRDPQAADHILATNGRRIVRALEVGEITGASFTAQLPLSGPPLIDHVSVGIDVPRESLDSRISRRVDDMFAAGFVEEVRELLDHHGLRDARTAGRALGYAQVTALVEGASTLAAAREDIVQATRRYARRQQRWFSRDPRTTWVQPGESPLSTARQIVALWEASTRTLGA